MSFTFSGAETGTTYNYTISSSGGGTAVTGTGTIGSANHPVTGINTTSLSNGTLTLSVTLQDTAGNTGSAATDTVVKNTVVPIMSSGTLAGSNAYIDLIFSKGVYGSSNGVDPLNAKCFPDFHPKRRQRY